MTDTLLTAIRRRLVDGQLPCTVAHTIAHELGASPQQVGQTADEMPVRIAFCQLGLFGYGPKAEGRHKIVRPALNVDRKLATTLQARAKDGCLPCPTLWALASEFGLERLAVSDAVEALGLRITQCQLGCFE